MSAKTRTLILWLAILTACQPPRPPQPIRCEAGLTNCNGVCTNLLWDSNHCGDCEAPCNSLASDCVQGRCTCGAVGGCGDDEVCREGACLLPYANGKRCEFDVECHASTGDCCETAPCEGECICAAGRCTSICTPEQCDALDNDCNGIVDDGLDLQCYAADFHTANVGTCRVGVKQCANGRYLPCVGEVLPTAEAGLLGCDGLDNDCDGCPDPDGLGGCNATAHNYDVVLAIDVSGSMYDDIEAVRAAVNTMAAELDSPQFRFGLVIIAANEGGIGSDYLSIALPLSEYPPFAVALADLRVDLPGIEPSYDAVYFFGSGDWDADLSFRPGSVRVMIVFTDEQGQTMTTHFEEDTCNAAVGEQLAVVTLPVFYGDWDACAALFPLVPDPDFMAANLVAIFSSLCR